MPLPSSHACRIWGALILLTQLAFASDWRAPEVQLAEDIVHITGPAVISLAVTNRSSISNAEAEEIRRGLIGLLAVRGVRVWQADQAAANVQIYFSENLENYVWVGEIRQGAGGESIVLVSTPRPPASLSAETTSPLRLQATPLLSQPAPILDVAVVEGNPRRLLVLGRTEVAIHQFRDGRWALVQSLAFQSQRPLPRDLRGRIIPAKDHLFDAYLPGLICRSTKLPALSITCSAGEDPWPLGAADAEVSGFFSPTGNFFTGALVPGIGKQTTAPPFYSAARLPKANYSLWLFSGVDGQVHLLDGIKQETLGTVRWGSDIAEVHASCRSDRQVLATSAGGEGTDSVEAFAMSDGGLVSMGERLAIRGAVTALWTAPDGDTVTAVYRNRETGNYDALQLKLACSQ